MSDAIKTSNKYEIQAAEMPSMIPVGDLQNIQPSYRLNGKNYLKWSQFVRTFLKGNGRLSHLTGNGLTPGDPKYDTWDEADSMVMSWLWNSMTPEVSDTCMFLGTTKDIWDCYRQTYSMVRDAAQIYDINTRISGTKQGTNVLRLICWVPSSIQFMRLLLTTQTA